MYLIAFSLMHAGHRKLPTCHSHRGLSRLTYFKYLKKKKHFGGQSTTKSVCWHYHYILSSCLGLQGKSSFLVVHSPSISTYGRTSWWTSPIVVKYKRQRERKQTLIIFLQNRSSTGSSRLLLLHKPVNPKTSKSESVLSAIKVKFEYSSKERWQGQKSLSEKRPSEKANNS
jgi:hypothetical protein